MNCGILLVASEFAGEQWLKSPNVIETCSEILPSELNKS
jgi:hypothetical protein